MACINTAVGDLSGAHEKYGCEREIRDDDSKKTTSMAKQSWYISAYFV